MAWRDSRGSRTHLLLSIAAIALGIGALVAIRSFGDRMNQSIEWQTRSLLGADLTIRALQSFTPEMETLLNALPGEQVRETRFFTMASFPRTGSTRLSQVRALSDHFPFYGHFQTVPPDAAEAFLGGTGRAVVEESLMLQFDAQIGDTIRIGARDFTIAGRLERVSGEAPAMSAFLGPRVYIAMDAVPDTELLREGSLARYYAHYRLPPDEEDAQALFHKYRSRMTALRLEMETAEQRRAMAGGTLDHLYRYLNLGGFVALLLGGIGLAGSIQLYVRKKRPTVAVLRCLGADAHTAFMIYVLQASCAACIGALLGMALGGALQYALPTLLADFLPIPVEAGWSWSAAALSLLFGLALSVAFALYPLAPLRRIAPLAALRPDDSVERRRPDPLQLVVLGILALTLLGFSIVHMDRWTQGLALAAGLGAVFALLTLSARLLMWLARHAFREAWPLAWRQGIAGIHRPYNQTSVLLLSLGLGAFLLATLSFTQDNLVNQFRSTDRDGQPNMILFDIQGDQVAAIENMIHEQDLEHVETTPIVTMRLLEVNARSVGSLRDDPELDIPHWVLFREYRSTYRSVLDERENVVLGEWQGRVHDGADLIPISIAEGLSEHLGVGLGDRMTFNVQGTLLQTYVRSVRRVDWRQLRTNFFVIFPAGVLESAPQYYAMVTRAAGPEAAAQLQNSVISRYPNVSAIDLRMVVRTLDEVLDKAAYVIRFMALFSVLTGLLVLGGTVVTSRYDRMAEADLLRTLGATRGQLHRIMAAEYLILGGIASLTGLLLALAASWLVARRVFDMAFTPALWPLFAIPLSITGATLLVGFLSTHVLSERKKN